MSATPVKKLFIGANGYFGPGSGLGALDYGQFGGYRHIPGQGFRLPLALPAPFVWELHLSSLLDLPGIEVGLVAPAGSEPLRIVLTAGQRTEVIGVATGSSPEPVPYLAFHLSPLPEEARLMFLGLSILPLMDFMGGTAAPAAPRRRAAR